MSKLLDKIKGFLFPEPFEPGDPPPWLQRLQTAKYKAGTGEEFEFKFLDVRSIFVRKVSSFESVDGNGAYIQDNGLGGHRFPMVMFVDGPDNDLTAAKAIQSLTKTGEGILYHPTYGAINVVPGGEIEVINEYASAAGQTQIVVEFLETTGLLVLDVPPFDSVLQSVNDTAATALSDAVDVSDAADKSSFKNKVQAVAKKIKTAVDSMSGGIQDAQDSVDDTFDSINNGIDLIVGSPLLLARQMQVLINSPAQRLSLTKTKLAAYKSLAESIFGETPKPNGYDKTASNDFALNKLVAATAVASMAQVAQQNDFTKKSDFLNTAIELDTMLKSYADWVDDSNTALGAVEYVSGWGDLMDLVSISISTLVQQSFAGLTEFRFVTEIERATAEWCYELTGSATNSALWSFTENNNLGPDEMLIIPVGRELIYYG